jgi:hypothetical protein
LFAIQHSHSTTPGGLLIRGSQSRAARLSARALAGLTFANKTNCLPLAAADLFAYTAWGQRVGQKPIGTAKKPTKSEASYRGNLFWVELNRDSLNSLHEQAIMFAHDQAVGTP